MFNVVNWVKGFFKQPPNLVVEGSVPETNNTTIEVKDCPIKKTDFEEAKSKFNPNTDILVISKSKLPDLDPSDLEWLHSQGNKVIYFEGDALINVAIVRSGYGWK